MKHIKEMYHSMLSDGGFFLDNEHRQPYNEFTCYTLQADKGQGIFGYIFMKICLKSPSEIFFFLMTLC